MLAKTQANMVYAAIGNTDPALKDSSITPINQYEQHLCNNQKIRSTEYASFSLFGLYFTYITGAIIIFLHRLAHEEIESQQWSGCTDSVPTVLPEANLASLNIEDLDHPTLARSTKLEEEVVEGNPAKTVEGAKSVSDANSENTAINGESSEDGLTDYLGLGSMISSIRPSSWDPLQWTYSTSQSPLSDQFADF
ncbi:hypothetical protein KJ359_006991 [Pestalotiopsis sp. 9143b]|nr:hypothetical protein KJ359_006991 [Pestalotiopsis sp. 9143b]